MPLGEVEGCGPGSEIIATGRKLTVPVGHGLVGRVLMDWVSLLTKKDPGRLKRCTR